jgi:hypothetical protein
MIRKIAIALLILTIPSTSFAMRVPWGVWKGLIDFKFAGKITDSKTGKAITEFQLGPLTPIAEAQTITTNEGNYEFTLRRATTTGQTYIRNFKTVRALGKPAQYLTLEITAKGYEKKIIDIPQDQIIVGQAHKLDIEMVPVNK